MAWSYRRPAGSAGIELAAWNSDSSPFSSLHFHDEVQATGLGIILTSTIALSGTTDMRSVKAAKNLLAAVVSATAILIFGVQGSVAWIPALVMSTGALFGGFAGGYLVRILPAEIVRSIVIFVGAVMTLIYAAKYWT